ncbi:MAG: GIY-YIG nuclease family protein [Verrucomicrobia bacterium]|nr:GIY-YIG nuclease family protein [Verrucomicrobiota bacterium]
MLRLPPENRELANAVLDVVIRQRSRVATDGERAVVSRIAEAVHQIWELRKMEHNVNKAPKSLALRNLTAGHHCVDHPVPQSHLAQKLLSLPQEDLRAPYISNLLHQYGFFCLITTEEQSCLTKAGLAEQMPIDWNGIDRYARYSKVGICLGEDCIYTRDEFQQLLEKPAASFYVYRLRTPDNKVFYIGKGEGFRAFSHEKELYKKSFRTHTNWKKLNKIAEIIRAGKAIGYEIESWHFDETQAFLREEELILMAERANPWLLCNSNGRRWAGKPNQHLTALRVERGFVS